MLQALHRSGGASSVHAKLRAEAEIEMKLSEAMRDLTNGELDAISRTRPALSSSRTKAETLLAAAADEVADENAEPDRENERGG